MVSAVANQVLIADDDPNFLDTMETIVTDWGYDVLSARHGMDVWQILLSENAPKMMILDWIMPGMDGLEICRRVRSIQNGDYVYIILVTIKDQIEHLKEGFSAGADDYLTKPIVLTELEARLNAGRRILELHSEIMSAFNQLQVHNKRDVMTSLWNRGGICEITEREMSRAARTGAPLSVITLGLEFHTYDDGANDHLVIDKFIIDVVGFLKNEFRIYDSIGRLGQNKFLIVLPDCDVDAALHLAGRILRMINAREQELAPNGLFVKVNLGVASTSMSIALDEIDLITAAETALNKAKQGGSGRIEVRSPLPGFSTK
ncbi:MAG: response regulator [Anaerolineales bacterium]|nr:response regulator [Anaerolineales bacterium]